MERALAEVTASQAAMIQKLGTQAPRLAPEAIARALDAHLKQVKAVMQLRPEMRVVWVAHQDLISSPQPVCEDIQTFLEAHLNLAAMAAQVEPSLYRQRGSHAPLRIP